MEAAAGVAAAGRGISLSMPSSQSSRKEWRVVSETSVRNSSNEELVRSKLGHSDERLIYEVQQGREPADVDFCSITIDGSLGNDVLHQRLHSVVKQREELQQMETDLRAQLIARGEIMEMRNSYDAKIKEHTNANIKLQEQLREKEQRILELERKMEDKERELHAIRLDNEAAWAKEDLLIEQSKELQSYRRERDNTEAERAQHIKQIHDLQEHFQEKEQQILELQEQNRIAQETILFKDEQLRDAQAWIARIQEMDALQSSTNHSLQAELRERTEQYNQLWLGCQRQFAEMERLHLHLQQLQLELADARERNNTYSDGSHVSQTTSKDVSQIGQSNGSQLDMSGSGSPAESSSLPNGNADNSSFVSVGNASMQADHAHGVPIAPSSLLGMPTYLPHGQVTALHSFVMHQQGVPHSVPSHVGHFHSVPAMSSLQQWQNQQVISECPQIPTQDQHPPLKPEATMLRPESAYDYESSVNGQVLHPDYVNANISEGMEPHSAVSSSNVEGQALESIDKSYLSGAQPQQSLQQISSQFHDALRLDNVEHKNDTKERNVNLSSNAPAEAQGLMMEKTGSASNESSSEEANHAINFNGSTTDTVADVVISEAFAAGQKNTGIVGKLSEANLLDERSLLACIVRTIPPVSGGRIRISSTLPNRLGKMIAPLHWHDYKKKYGKLDEFVASHPELFVIEGDYIQLREGAQGIIAATAAVAKVAAAAAETSSYSSLLPSVAVTPMAQSHRLKRAPSIESTSGKSDHSMFKEYAVSRPPNAIDNSIQLSAMRNQHPNGVSFSIAGGVSNVKILSKHKDHLGMNGSERLGQSVLLTVGNGINSENDDFGSSQNTGSSHWKTSVNAVGKLQGRAIGAAASPRR
ncbi:hypothetical protein ACH5RR_017284 [Cinchona calisaya]|uniref:DUF7725 domain-containing protein n=1 Tax=Cinchona calisaya TaxID=153742 RepID=A0ABD2ZYB3_9GENT